MVVLNKIYTRTGDGGDTALGNGERIAKQALRVSAYGTTDELNSFVGVARLHAEGEIDTALSRIQNDLFDLGADLCRPDMDNMIDAQVDRLESEIDAMNTHLRPLRSFILPGGGALAAQLHVCRTVSRRAERLAVELAATEAVNTSAVKYLNRLSDWFFVAARMANNNGEDDVLWVPGANR
ncbi:UNVERIFIED_CONTAM: hypothetical protein GTU68_019973 [Idotea baltica]|nr:hypothetical protein [Idotea baltica]